MSTTATLNRTDGTTNHSKKSVPRTGDIQPSQIRDWGPAPIQSRRKRPKTRPLELQNTKTTKPPLTLKTSRSDISRSPQDVNTPESQPQSAYTYSAFPSTSPKHARDVERRPSNSTWAVPRRAYVPTSIPRDNNVRCNILYVSNLPTETSEEELDGIFASQAGYRRMSLRTTESGPSCFVEFDDVTTAARALRNLYGWPLKNSRMGGIRLSFSRDHVGIPPPRPLTPRSPKRLPPPSPLILPVRTPPPSPSGFSSAAPAHPIAVPTSSSPSIEIESVSSPSIEELPTRLLEDKPDELNSAAEAEREIPSLSIPKVLAWTGMLVMLGFMLVPYFAPLSLFMVIFMMFVRAASQRPHSINTIEA